MLTALVPIVSGDLSFAEVGRYPGGATYAMAKSGSTLFTGTGTIVEIWDVSASGVSPQNYMVWPGTNEIRPQKIGEIRTGDFAVGGLLVQDGTLFAGTERGLEVYDVTDPTKPVMIGSHYKEPYGTLKRVGNLLYVSTDFYYYDAPGTHRLVILDVSDLTNIKELGSFKIPIAKGTLQRFEVSGNYAYLPIVYDLTPGYVFFVDISNPANPVEVARVNGTGIAGYSAVQVDETKKILYALEYRSKLHAYDISNPAKPVEVGLLGTNVAEPLGQAADMKIRGNYAYISTFYEGLRTFDISNPSQMKLAAKGTSSSRFGYVFDVLLDGDYVYVANMGGGFSLFNIASPQKIKYVTQQDTHGIFYHVRVDGDHAYVSADYEFMVFDVSDPNHPVHTGSVEWARSGIGGVKGNYVFVDDGWRPLAIVDVSNPAKPVVAKQYSDHTKVGVIVGNTMYLGKKGQVQILDISNLPELSVRGIANITTKHAYPPSMAIKDQYLFAGFGFDGVKILDVTDPRHVTEVGAFLNGTRPNRMLVRNNYLYIMGDYYLFTYDITNPAKPVNTSQLKHNSWHTGGAYGIGSFAVYKNYLMSGEYNGIVMWDISTPAQPKPGVLVELPADAPGEISGFDFDDNGLVYATASYKGLVINNYSEKTQSVPVIQVTKGKNEKKPDTLSLTEDTPGISPALSGTDANSQLLLYRLYRVMRDALFWPVEKLFGSPL